MTTNDVREDGGAGKLPGERWSVGDASGRNANMIWDCASGESIATVYGIPTQWKLAEVQADPSCVEALGRAYKIAAAPDLLAALEECRNLMYADNPADGWADAIAAADAAIAKARGDE